jgi:predicted Zn-dependent protease
VGYSPPAENFQARLDKILKGEDTYLALQKTLSADPNDVAAIFKVARKWGERYDAAKAMAEYNKVIALDPQGKAGTFTDEETQITAPYTDFAKYAIAEASFQSRKPDPAPVESFIAGNPASPLVRQAYRDLESYFARSAPKEAAEAFYAKYAARYPDDPGPLAAWLGRIVRDKGPVDKGLELAQKLRGLMASDPGPSINRTLAQMYDLAGEKAKAEGVYGKDFVDRYLSDTIYTLTGYANYWLDQGKNLDSVKEMADIVAATLGASKDVPSYYLGQVASVYLRAGEDDKALGVYGPAWLEKTVAARGDRDANSYASFWLRSGKNLESALAAAKASVEMQPKAYFYWSTLSDVYAKTGDKAQAVKAAETAVSLAQGRAKEAMQKKLDALSK